MFEKILICTDFADGLHRLTHFVTGLAAGGIKPTFRKFLVSSP